VRSAQIAGSSAPSPSSLPIPPRCSCLVPGANAQLCNAGNAGSQKDEDTDHCTAINPRAAKGLSVCPLQPWGATLIQTHGMQQHGPGHAALLAVTSTIMGGLLQQPAADLQNCRLATVSCVSTVRVDCYLHGCQHCAPKHATMTHTVKSITSRVPER
jgi:hypothetical protein